MQTAQSLLTKRSNYEMSSNSYMEKDWQDLQRELKWFIKMICKKYNYTLAKTNSIHYWLSAYIVHNDKHLYISFQDFRSSHCWLDQIMYRECKSIKDSTWWANQWTSLHRLEDAITFYFNK